jgi:enamine deaminase RidA (YjgF/YER057c/UK114 family)
MTSIADRLTQLGLQLPSAPKPVAAYIPAVRSGNLVFVSGQIPMLDGKLLCTGPVPSHVTIDQARIAARQCVLNALAVLKDVMQIDLDRVSRIVRLGVFVCSDPGFTDQPKVANGASELLHEIFGECGRHARAAVGSIALPLGASVEVEMIVEIAGSDKHSQVQSPTSPDGDRI